MYRDIRYDVDDPVGTITLDRPQALNAWTDRMGLEVRDAVAQAERDPAVVAIVLTGAGRGFCAGADLNLLSGLAGGAGGAGGAGATTGASDDDGPDGADRGLSDEMLADVVAGDPSWGEDFRGAYTYLLSVPKPVIAAINGPIAGMAVPIALSTDLRFMATDAVLTCSFSQRGLVAEWGLSWLLPRLVGPAVALDLLYSSRKVDGVECERLGLVNRAVPGDDLLRIVRDYVIHFADTCSPASLAIMKRQVNQQLHAGLGPAEREAQRLMVESFGRPDFGEGVQSFLQKRPPRFARLGTST